MSNLKTGPWKLSDIKGIPKNGLKVFSCFHCGGGSTMGYKLAGYEMLGGVEIDPKIMAIYRENHNPKHSYLMGVQDFNKIPADQIPKELFNLDILDGSPPCSSFSMSGSRESAWGEKKKFREGQANQVLDDLFFDFLDTAKILKPKVVIAENVKGMVMGKAKGYVKLIAERFEKEGYDMQLFLLNSAFMGVPQRRERTFFIGRRKDLKLPNLKLSFNEKPITVREAFGELSEELGASGLNSINYKYYRATSPGSSLSKVHPKGHLFNSFRLDEGLIAPTVTGNSQGLYREKDMYGLTKGQFSRLQSFPDDFDFLDQKPGYVCGMSVPPFMMQRVSDQIHKQWFNLSEQRG